MEKQIHLKIVVWFHLKLCKKKKTGIALGNLEKEEFD